MKGSKYLFLLVICCIGLSELFGKDQPNILSISVEDISADIGCYGDKNAHTPVLDNLASSGVRYTNAIANAPVCAPARSVIITGMYQTSIGAHNHRSSRGAIKNHLPKGMKTVPELFRAAGYYTSNVAFDGNERLLAADLDILFDLQDFPPRRLTGIGDCASDGSRACRGPGPARDPEGVGTCDPQRQFHHCRSSR